MWDAHTIPRGMDRPVPILLWDPAEFIVALMLIGIGVVMKMLVIGLLGAVAVMLYSIKIKRRGKRGTALHFMWRMGYLIDPVLKKRFSDPTYSEFTR